MNYPHVLVTYDIACQYSKKIVKRFSNTFGTSAGVTSLVKEALFAVPKMHVQGHKEDCQYCYSLNYMEHVGRTAGELIETAWAEANNIGPSTREMSPGHRHDVLNDLYDFWNWWKTFGMGMSLLQIHLRTWWMTRTSIASSLARRLSDAKRQAQSAREYFEGFSAANKHHIQQWSKESTVPRLVNGEWTSVYKVNSTTRKYHSFISKAP